MAQEKLELLQNELTGMQSPANRHGRLTIYQIESIRRAAREVIGGATLRIWLFGSRADGARRGGDIDLFIETNKDLPNRAEAICRIYAKIIMALGDRKVDVLLKGAKTPEAPCSLLPGSLEFYYEHSLHQGICRTGSACLAACPKRSRLSCLYP